MTGEITDASVVRMLDLLRANSASAAQVVQQRSVSMAESYNPESLGSRDLAETDIRGASSRLEFLGELQTAQTLQHGREQESFHYNSDSSGAQLTSPQNIRALAHAQNVADFGRRGTVSSGEGESGSSGGGEDESQDSLDTLDRALRRSERAGVKEWEDEKLQRELLERELHETEEMRATLGVENTRLPENGLDIMHQGQQDEAQANESTAWMTAFNGAHVCLSVCLCRCPMPISHPRDAVLSLPSSSHLIFVTPQLKSRVRRAWAALRSAEYLQSEKARSG